MKRPWLLVLPSFILLVLVLLGPELHGVYISFFREKAFVGLRNYQNLLKEADFYFALWNSFLFTFLSVGLELVLGFGIALLLDKKTRGKRITRSLAIVPFIVTPVIGGFAWKMMLDTNYGILNYFLTFFGFPMGTIEWLSNPNLAMLAVIVADAWVNTPFVTLILLAGLQALPQSPYEAAKVDGASYWFTFKRITIPLLMPAILVAVIFRLVFAFREFTTIWVMTQGGPLNSTYVLAMYIYKNMFLFFKDNYSAAIGVIMLILTFLISVPLMVKMYAEIKS
jgi:multiple sugar transport system permease protein